MQLYSMKEDELEPEAREFYRSSLLILRAAGIQLLVGGAYAFARYTGIERHTKDFDIFVRPQDAEPALDALARAGYQTEMAFPHWLGKAYLDDYFVDIIFGAGNGVAEVDDLWLEHATDEILFGVPVKLIPAEEMIWSKSFVMERERYDGADIAHVIRARGDDLDWKRLVRRFGSHWRVLFSHLVLFGFVYPGERSRVPAWVMNQMTDRLKSETERLPPPVRICRGTLISRAQYLVDIEQWGYKDARLTPRGNMSPEDVENWTAAIEEDK